jgi:CheY-like chemotaxis protein
MIKVLLVDDDADFRSMLQSALQLAGYTVAVARNGREAVAVQRRSRSDVMITDLFMPESDGFEAIEAFRRDFPATRIIAVSGGASLVKTNYLDAAGLMGVDATLQKPFDVEDLLRVLRTMQ